MKKSLGQNFLKDEYFISKIVDSFELKPDDTVLEIGPGGGALTSRLSGR
ncbi:MAG: rRNA adenine N-6-methyltransferase family protein, partial [Candidatus Delongbacteria bacterium]